MPMPPTNKGMSPEEYDRLVAAYKEEQAQQQKEQAVIDAEAAEARKAGLQPTRTEVGTSTTEGFFTDTTTPQMAFFLDPAFAGNMTELEKADFYDYMRQAQGQGQNIYGQQQSLADALLARSQGRGGPSLAELQLGQTLDTNRRDVARRLAGAGRGINPALAQRLLMQEQARLNQTAAGQSAILRAQEQLAAQTALGNQLAQMRGAETSMFGTAGQLGLGQAKSQAELAEAQKARDLQVAIENQRAAQAAAGQAQAQGQFEANADIRRAEATSNAAVETAKAIDEANKNNPATQPTPSTPTPPAAKAHGGYVRKYAEGGKVKAAMGALTKMDNEKNDVVPAMLSPGEIVLPRSIVNSPNAPVAAAKFVEALMANKDKKNAKMLALKAALSKK